MSLSSQEIKMLEIIEATATNPMKNRPEFKKQVNLLKHTENTLWE